MDLNFTDSEQANEDDTFRDIFIELIRAVSELESRLERYNPFQERVVPALEERFVHLTRRPRQPPRTYEGVRRLRLAYRVTLVIAFFQALLLFLFIRFYV